MDTVNNEALTRYFTIRVQDILRLWYFEENQKVVFNTEESIYRVKDGGKEVATMLLEGSFNIPLPNIFSGGRKEYDLRYLVKYIMDKVS